MDALRHFIYLNEDEVPGEYLKQDLAGARVQENQQGFLFCESDKKKVKGKKFDLILIASFGDVEVPELRSSRDMHLYFGHEYKDLRLSLKGKEVSELNSTEFNALVNEISNDDDFSSSFADLLLIGASQFYDPDNVNSYAADKKYMEWFSQNVKEANFSEEEFLTLLNKILSTLSSNYNSPRLFTDQADSDRRYFTRQANGIINGVLNDGGVCNDIHAVGCDLFNSVYPDKDCLVLGYNVPRGGYHEVMAIGSGVGDYKILDYSRLTSLEGSRFLTADTQNNLRRANGEFIRVQKYEEGKLKDLTLVKNEYGQFVHEIKKTALLGGMGGEITDFLKPQDPNYFALNLIKSIKHEEGKKLGLGIGRASLSDGAEVYAVYARYEKAKKDLDGISVSLMATQKRDESAYVLNRFHLDTIFNKGIIHFKKPYLEVKGAGFVDLELMGGFGVVKQGPDDLAFDGTLGGGLNALVDYQKNGTNILGQVQQRWNIGSRDYNAMHGVFTDLDKTLAQIKFHHQSFEANVQAERELDNKTKVIIHGQYLGTNIGQNFGARGGLQITNPHDDVELVVMVGYAGKAKGYKTIENWHHQMENEGANLSLGFVKKDTGASIEVRGTLGSKPSGRVQVRTPLGLPRKKEKPLKP